MAGERISIPRVAAILSAATLVVAGCEAGGAYDPQTKPVNDKGTVRAVLESKGFLIHTADEVGASVSPPSHPNCVADVWVGDYPGVEPDVYTGDPYYNPENGGPTPEQISASRLAKLCKKEGY